MLAALILAAVTSGASDLKDEILWMEGKVELAAGGPLAFGPSGILFVGDPKSATIHAILTQDEAGKPGVVEVENLHQKVAALLGVETSELMVNDMAVNPASGRPYLSVSRGRGPDAAVVLLRVSDEGALEELSLDAVSYDVVALPNPPSDEPAGRRRQSQRTESITDLLFVDGRLFIAGLSNEEFASKLRALPVPFEDGDAGTSVEIYHGAHGAFETRSPVRTFAHYLIDDMPHLLAAYTCTPLVKFPIEQLAPGEKVIGTTIAELGNRNRPLDMVVYQKGGEDFILIANSSRGMMKVSTKEIATAEGIESRISGGGTAGLAYETLEDVKGVVQMDRLDDGHVLILVQDEAGAMHLQKLALP